MITRKKGAPINAVTIPTGASEAIAPVSGRLRARLTWRSTAFALRWTIRSGTNGRRRTDTIAAAGSFRNGKNRLLINSREGTCIRIRASRSIRRTMLSVAFRSRRNRNRRSRKSILNRRNLSVNLLNWYKVKKFLQNTKKIFRNLLPLRRKNVIIIWACRSRL